MEVTRSYDHRGGKGREGFGHIGKATLVAPDGDWTLDGKPLPESGVAHLLNFALQTLQDAYAGSESAVEAQAAFEKKRDAILGGTIGVRGGGGVSDVEKVMHQLAKRDYAATITDKDKRRAFNALTAGELRGATDAVIAADPDGYRERAEAEIARRAAEAAKRAEEIAKAMSAVNKAKIDLDALLKG